MYYICKVILQINNIDNQAIVKLSNSETILFNILKSEIQAKYLESHTPSEENISQWKGIDIVYFQEDLRKIAKGNLSEKTFYTYFKSNSTEKLPRIDMLNLLCNYVGYESWSDFKKKSEDKTPALIAKFTEVKTLAPISEQIKEDNKKSVLNKTKNSISKQVRTNIWLSVSFFLVLVLLFTVFKDDIFGKTYTYCFTDGDRNTQIKDVLEIRVIKENESPLLFRIKNGECFVYKTKDKSLKMVINSPFYKEEIVNRNLKNASENENIELTPDDNAIMLYYYSKSIKDLWKKRRELDRLISNDAIIYQVFDNDFYGVETLTKEKYITLVTLPSTSLENLNVLEIQMDKDKKKIKKIKFKINNNEKI